MLHIVIMSVLLVIAVAVVVIDIRRGKAKEEAMRPVPVVEEVVVDQPRQALVVDDSPTMRATIRRLLEQQDYEVVEATDGHEALQRFSELTSSPAFITAIVDSDMPGDSGMEFVRSVRAKAENDRLRIIVMTTDTETDDGLISLRKPFTSEALLATLRSPGS